MTTALPAPDQTSRTGAIGDGPSRWRDGKRYAWLLGILVPTLPFIVYGLVQVTGVPLPRYSSCTSLLARISCAVPSDMLTAS